MEDIAKRLRDATDSCLVSYGLWSDDRKNSGVREKLMEAVHELRKVAARLEIDMAVSERDEMASKPLPIPPHRSSSKRPQERHEDDDNSGNRAPGGNGGNGGGMASNNLSRSMRRPRRPGGGGQQDGNQAE